VGILGVAVVCLVVGFLLGIPILWTIGIIAVAVALILMVFSGAASGPRRYWYGRWW